MEFVRTLKAQTAPSRRIQYDKKMRLDKIQQELTRTERRLNRVVAMIAEERSSE